MGWIKEDSDTKQEDEETPEYTYDDIKRMYDSLNAKLQSITDEAGELIVPLYGQLIGNMKDNHGALGRLEDALNEHPGIKRMTIGREMEIVITKSREIILWNKRHSQFLTSICWEGVENVVKNALNLIKQRDEALLEAKFKVDSQQKMLIELQKKLLQNNQNVAPETKIKNSEELTQNVSIDVDEKFGIKTEKELKDFIKVLDNRWLRYELAVKNKATNIALTKTLFFQHLVEGSRQRQIAEEYFNEKNNRLIEATKRANEKRLKAISERPQEPLVQKTFIEPKSPVQDIPTENGLKNIQPENVDTLADMSNIAEYKKPEQTERDEQ